MLKRLATAALAILTLTGAPVQADKLVVVELFTSQGCSSCPPADALLAELTRQEGVLPLALHVDYWDYIGWKDDFARPEHTERQKAYAAAVGARSIYTPQMVVGGKDHVVGFKPGQLAKLLMVHSDMPERVSAAATRNGGSVTVSVSAAAPVAASDILLVRYVAERSVDIRRGENAGQKLTYHNIVADLRPIGTWDGRGEFSASVSAEGEGAFAILVQERNAGPIVAAARVR